MRACEVLQMPFGWSELHEHDRIAAPYGHPRPAPFRQVKEIGDRSFRRNAASLEGALIYGDRVLHIERGALSNLWEEICFSSCSVSFCKLQIGLQSFS